MQFTSDPSLCCVIRSAIERLAEVVGFAAEDTHAIILAVDEALTNIIRHAYGGKHGKSIHVSCNRVEHRVDGKTLKGLEIKLLDAGKAMNLRDIPERPLSEVRPGGLGLHFIRQCMHRVEYRRTRGKNHLRLVKYFPEAKAVPTK